ncbi:hypothetical protein LCGC14_3168440, partial [marine sediment metagenome]
MKVIHREVYQVQFSLGCDPDNIVWGQTFIGVPTKEKITACLKDALESLYGGVCYKPGLPGKEFDILILKQCLFLVSTFEIPEAGLTMSCSLDCHGTIGHITFSKIAQA